MISNISNSWTTSTHLTKMANSFHETKHLPYKQFEISALMSLLRPHVVPGVSHVLELGCGDGFYSRLVSGSLNPQTLTACDMSFALIQESKKLSPNCSIEYIIHDSLDLPVLHSQQNEEHAPFYDISFAAYLFCLASTEEELVQMLESIYKNLKPGGLFVTVTDNIFDSSAMYSDDTASLGIVKESNKIRRDGDEVIVKFMQQQDNNQQCHQEHTPECEPHVPNSVESERHQYTELCRVTNYWLSPAAYERAFKKAGFSHWEWIEMPTTGIEEFDRNPPITLLKLIK